MKKPIEKPVCLCNKISKSEIEAAILRGCKTVQKVALATTAGAGQCGGSCQPEIKKIIDSLTKQSVVK